MYKISNNSEVVIFLLGEMRWNDSLFKQWLVLAMAFHSVPYRDVSQL